MLQIVFIDLEDKTYSSFDSNFDFISELIFDNLDILDEIARECNVAKLSGFKADYIVENFYEIGTCGEWFPISAGLATLDALINYLKTPKDAGKSKAVRRKARRLISLVTEELEELRKAFVFEAQDSRNFCFKLVLLRFQDGVPVVAQS